MKQSKCTGAVVSAITPYRHNLNIDFAAFGRYIEHMAAEGAGSIIVPGRLSDTDQLSMEERGLLVQTAARVAGKKACVIATVQPGQLSAGEQTAFYLEKGADAVNIHYPSGDIPALKEAVAQASAAGAEHILLTDSKSGGFDMNSIAKGVRPPVGIPDDAILELFREVPALKGLIISLPLNECGPKTSRLKKALGERINIIADTATDQMPEQLERGAEGFITGAFPKLFNRLFDAHAQGGYAAMRPLFFRFLPVIVWTKQYIHREPYLYQRYLQDAGIIPNVSFRTPRPLDRYMVLYGEEMLKLVKEL